MQPHARLAAGMSFMLLAGWTGGPTWAADETPPAGRITAPTAGTCFGPGTLPVLIEDDFVDDRDPELERRYSPPARRQRRIDTPANRPGSFGYSVALDGDLLAVGGPSINDRGGLAYTYRKTAGEWRFETIVAPPTPSGGKLFGWDLAADNDRLVVTAPFTTIGSLSWSGRAHVFHRDGSRWSPFTDLRGDEDQFSREFGRSVDVAGDWIVVSSFREDVFGMRDAGAVYLFREGPTVWQKLIEPDASVNGLFGLAVSIDGDTLAVSTHLKRIGGVSTGIVRIYTLLGQTWTETAVLQASDMGNLRGFGISLDLAGDLLVVGAVTGNAFDGLGAAWAFERRDGVWVETAKLVEPGAEDLNHGFGGHVATDGETIAVSAALDSTSGEQAGSLYLYRRTALGWRPYRKLLAADPGTNDRFGSAIAVDGSTVVVGAPGRFVSTFPVPGKIYLHEAIAEPLYVAHGDHEVTLEVADDDGNLASDSVGFVIDILPPNLLVIEPPRNAVLDDQPFDILFEADDIDVASGDVTHEVVSIQGCPAFDGSVYGDGDGLLRDEILHVDTAERCRIADECGFDELADVELLFEVTDCAGSVTAETRLHPGGPLRLRTGACDP